MAKKLRLAAAGLTDVGRRRERNQDAVTHFVPQEEDVLAEKGALFVVCDGMGGHAAGEVASELGVNTIRDVYYASESSDIITGLANAIKQANQTIFQYAREHTEMTGMGTTCVALVVQGGRAYFLNIGDSRGYLVRESQMRQITLDHSWVAEQVRAGLLTDEQARTHAHRNVITRSLGTQPTVSADLFIERLQDGDRVLLCSDGLHGYVDEAEIERTVQADMDPDGIAQNLINMANDNGGPDNITAILVHLLEVPQATGEVRLPEDVVGEEQIITQPIPAMPRLAPTQPATSGANGATRPDSASPAPNKLPRVPSSKRKRPNPVAVAAIRLLAVAALLIVSAGIWDFSFGPYALARAAATQTQADIQQARRAAQQAQTQPPNQALAALAQARQRIESDLRNPNLDAQSRQNAEIALTTQITPAVQSSVQRYNTAALIQPVSMGGLTQYPVACAVPGQQALSALTSATALAAVTTPPAKSGPPAPQQLYAINGGQLDQVRIARDTTGAPAAGASAASCFAVPLANVSTVIALAADGAALYVLAEQGTSSYTVLSVATSGANADGSPRFTIQRRFAVPTPNSQVPTSLAESAGTFYIGYSESAGAGGIWTFTGTAPKSPSQSVSLAQAPATLALSGGTLYALLADGSLGQLDTAHRYLPLPVQVPSPLSIIDPGAYSAAAPVPTAATPASSDTTTTPATTLFPASAVLVTDPALSGHILVGDGASNRLVRFTANQGQPGLGLAAQYVYTAPLAHGSALALAANGATLTAYTWDGSQLAAFSISEPAGA
ncbi:MAG TPA: Stp1/IreP family PP2C-type Ser/Thr phosphatase [Ktedonobacterales bacterium]|nr:Stp1/IreP family PP2C-type Ser/Thr phosphatase [Ktedonobacterales bacterium]